MPVLVLAAEPAPGPALRLSRNAAVSEVEVVAAVAAMFAVGAAVMMVVAMEAAAAWVVVYVCPWVYVRLRGCQGKQLCDNFDL